MNTTRKSLTTIVWGFAASALLVLAACEKEVEWDTSNYQPKLVVNALFNPDSSWAVEVAKSQSVVAEEVNFEVTDAVVKLFEANELQAFATLDLASDGGNGETSIYRVQNFQPEPGKSYTITVEKSGFETVIAERAAVPTQPTIDAAVLNTDLESDFEFRGSIDLTFTDDPNDANYYHLIIRRPSFTQGDGSITLSGYDPEAFNLGSFANAFDYYEEGFLFSDEDFNGQIRTVNCALNTFFDPDLKPYDHFFVELRGVSQDYYEYHKTANDQFYSPINKYVEVHTNIQNGLGIFAGYNAATEKVSF